MGKNKVSKIQKVSKAEMSRVMSAIGKRGVAARKKKYGKNYMRTKDGRPLWEIGGQALKETISQKTSA